MNFVAHKFGDEEPLPHHLELQRQLAREGGLYTVEDVVDLIKRGHMQGFVEKDTWVITEILEFPRKRVLALNFIVGNEEDFDVLHEQVIAFAREHGCEMLWGRGREGWIRRIIEKFGWEYINVTYAKEL